MKKLSQKGFSLVELLAVVVILGILATIGLGAYNYYSFKARYESTDYLGRSAISAAESYILDHPGAQKVDIGTLVDLDYLENDNDPGTNSPCKGTVRIAVQKSRVEGQIDDYNIIADICCSTGNYQYDNKGGKAKTTACQADEELKNFIGTASECSSTIAKTVQIYTYESTEFERDCAKDAAGNYAQCKDGNGNYPCRIYEYHARNCSCRFSSVGSKYCSSTVAGSGQVNNLTKVYYYDNKNGRKACSSPNIKDANSYVARVGSTAQPDSEDYLNEGGYLFYKGKSGQYENFQPEGKVYHKGSKFLNSVFFDYDVNAIKRYNSNGAIDYETACKDTCTLLAASSTGN